MVLIMSGVSSPADDTPIKTSAPARTSDIGPVMPDILVNSRRRRLESFRSVRSGLMMPLVSTANIRGLAYSCSNLAMATPAAPAPTITIFKSANSRPVTLQALISPARVTMAVPCWSSCISGIFRLAFSRSSTSKQIGAAMSSKLIAPKLGAIASTVRTMSSAVWTLRTIGMLSMLAKCLKSRALPSMTGMAPSGPRLPSPRTAEPSEMTATRLLVQV